MLIRRDRAMVAVTVMLDVAFHAGRSGTVRAAEMAERLGLARRGMEPLLQELARAGLLCSVRGPRGGYRLGRPAREIGVAEIVAAALADGEAGPESGGALQAAVVDPLWRTVDAAALAVLAAVTLEELLRRAAAAGLRRPRAEPISFVI